MDEGSFQAAISGGLEVVTGEEILDSGCDLITFAVATGATRPCPHFGFKARNGDFDGRLLQELKLS